MDRLVPGGAPAIAAAVSGGGDSLALALLLNDWAAARGGKIIAFTVDHALRPGSGDEARRAGEILRGKNIAHKILTWSGEKPATHIQEKARQARYDLLLAACRAQGCARLALAHNAEDQAETFWMRLAHGSGLDGLAGMAAARDAEGVTLLRPLLSFSRAELRATCAAYGVQWIDDPSNENEKFLRVRLRRFEDVLAAEGLTPERLSQTAQKLARAREALEFYTAQAFMDCVTVHPEAHAALDLARWREHPPEIQSRVLAKALQSVQPQDYPPGFDALEALRLDLLSPSFRGRTLAGCEIFPHRGGVYVRPETLRQINSSVSIV